MFKDLQVKPWDHEVFSRIGEVFISGFTDFADEVIDEVRDVIPYERYLLGECMPPVREDVAVMLRIPPVKKDWAYSASSVNRRINIAKAKLVKKLRSAAKRGFTSFNNLSCLEAWDRNKKNSGFPWELNYLIYCEVRREE
jgi:hypothetical protein